MAIRNHLAWDLRFREILIEKDNAPRVIAKGLLMAKEGLSEQEAFARLRKASQVSGRPLKVVAEAVVATLDP